MKIDKSYEISSKEKVCRRIPKKSSCSKSDNSGSVIVQLDSKKDTEEDHCEREELYDEKSFD